MLFLSRYLNVMTSGDWWTDVAGVRQLPIDSQIMMVQQAMYPIVLLTYSLDYDLVTGDYNYFSLSHDEEAYIQSYFTPFKMLVQTFHILGNIVQRLKVDDIESAFLCGLCLLSQSNGRFSLCQGLCSRSPMVGSLCARVSLLSQSNGGFSLCQGLSALAVQW